MKKPIVAAILNILPGLGYVYGRVRTRFGILLLLASAFSVADLIVNQNVNDAYSAIPFTPIGIGSLLFFAAAFIYDAYSCVNIANNTKN